LKPDARYELLLNARCQALACELTWLQRGVKTTPIAILNATSKSSWGLPWDHHELASP
jgi:hypothetical protein